MHEQSTNTRTVRLSTWRASASNPVNANNTRPIRATITNTIDAAMDHPGSAAHHSGAADPGRNGLQRNRFPPLVVPFREDFSGNGAVVSYLGTNETTM